MLWDAAKTQRKDTTDYRDGMLLYVRRSRESNSAPFVHSFIYSFFTTLEDQVYIQSQEIELI